MANVGIYLEVVPRLNEGLHNLIVLTLLEVNHLVKGQYQDFQVVKLWVLNVVASLCQVARQNFKLEKLGLVREKVAKNLKRLYLRAQELSFNLFK